MLPKCGSAARRAAAASGEVIAGKMSRHATFKRLIFTAITSPACAASYAGRGCRTALQAAYGCSSVSPLL
jgi:hypothetical protein